MAGLHPVLPNRPNKSRPEPGSRRKMMGPGHMAAYACNGRQRDRHPQACARCPTTATPFGRESLRFRDGGGLLVSFALELAEPAIQAARSQAIVCPCPPHFSKRQDPTKPGPAAGPPPISHCLRAGWLLSRLGGPTVTNPSKTAAVSPYRRGGTAECRLCARTPNPQARARGGSRGAGAGGGGSAAHRDMGPGIRPAAM